ncbi:MarR family transcriptional regulator [Pseudoxanthomonas sp. CF125]|uniref:MarR family winged helix-turn-helix transcriptional regulator n=1 Tax=Pseudoxanthomonas sp. CF125 TaxID=1855303 RepID=UPI000882AF8C|nr:MarR family transcriptional regulator [Pseudoxanthomonas sp. CF125]SDQ44237.1 DNA-binding transcriptional regulator, MarR family [Pseudoxanthomonas sp. CF125]
MSPSSQTPEANMGLLFRQVRDAMWADMAREMAAAGHELTYSQFVTIKRLATDSSDGVTDLARWAQVNPGAMTRLLDKLETRGLLRRIADPGDRRALHIVLTEAGQAIWSDIQHCGERVRARAMQGLDDGEREQLFRLLNQVLQNLTPPTANDD